MIEFTESGESTDHFWDQDLQDALNILGLDNYGNTHSSCYPVNNAIVILDESDQRPPALQHAFGEEANFFEVPQNIRQLPHDQKALKNKYVPEDVYSTSNPAMKVLSNCSVFPGNQHLQKVGQTETDYGASVVPTGKVPGTPSTSCKMDSPVFTTEASAFGVKRSRKNQAKLQAKYPDREETENSSPFKRKSRSPMQSASKLFGILSLILQALDGPLTTELEERYECVLQTTLIEIQNARRHLGTGQ